VSIQCVPHLLKQVKIVLNLLKIKSKNNQSKMKQAKPNNWKIVLPNPDDNLRIWLRNQAKQNKRSVGAELQVILENLSVN
jgi:chorismate synthase